jgi:hypothetical protein
MNQDWDERGDIGNGKRINDVENQDTVMIMMIMTKMISFTLGSPC